MQAFLGADHPGNLAFLHAKSNGVQDRMKLAAVRVGQSRSSYRQITSILDGAESRLALAIASVCRYYDLRRVFKKQGAYPAG